MLFCCPLTRAAFVCHHSVTKYERAEDRVCAYLNPKVCLFMQKCVCVCPRNCVTGCELPHPPTVLVYTPPVGRTVQIKDQKESEPLFFFHAVVEAVQAGGGMVEEREEGRASGRFN